jgi:[acyl-carrier-protein] S-malonyltransferase
MSYALLFSGQGTQHAGMLPWLEAEPAAAPALQAMVSALGSDWRERLNDAGWRDANRAAQQLLTGTSLAAWAALRSHLQAPPVVVAGYSVGELAAFGCAGAFDAASALALAADRADAMDEAVRGHTTGLLSVSGLREEAIGASCQALKLECAIRIAADHQILGGEDAALQSAEQLFRNQGGNCRRLAVQVASHTSWMHTAADRFARRLEAVQFRAVQCPVALNATGSATRRAATLREALSRQLRTTVQWASCMEGVAEYRPACVVEIGPGDALSRLWSTHQPHIPVRAADDFRSAAALAAWIEKTAGQAA